MFKKNDKVLVLSKSFGCTLADSHVCYEAKRIKQKFLYYIGTKEGCNYIHILNYKFNNDCSGDYFLAKDFVKYIEQPKFIEVLESPKV